MLRITGLTAERFHALYWSDRPDYDAGHLTGLEYWQKFNRDAGLNLSPRLLEELNLWDARYWTTENPAMLAWQLALKQSGIKTAILSNMGDNVRQHIERELHWFSRFDALVWSYELKIVKPNPAIYRYVLGKLGTVPQETLFIDDRQVNVDGANALGMIGVTFTTAEALRLDLVAMNLDSTLPLP
jgi:putative hydrolase of the HAD superfamily